MTVGTNKAQLRQRCPSVRDTVLHDAEGDSLSGSVIQFFGKTIALAEWNERGTLSKLRVHSPEVFTPAGLHVGSTMRELRRHIPRMAAGYDDGGVYVWEQGTRLGFSYLLQFNASNAFPSPDDVAKHVNQIPDSVRVRSVILVTQD